jgi:FtsZ-interacting cell division protein ZipA
MSDLLIGLIILGALIIAGVVVYNWMQEKKLRKEVSSDFIVPQKDVLSEDFYIDTDAFVEKELAEVGHKYNPSDSQTSKQAAETKNATFNDNVFNKPLSNLSSDPLSSDLHAQTEDDFDVIQMNVSADAIVESDELSLDNSAKDNSASTPSTGSFNSSPSQTKFENRQADNIVNANALEEMNSQPQLPADVSPQIDLTAILFANKTINNQSLNNLSASLKDIGLPVLTHGLDDAGKWHLVHENSGDAAFKQVACSVQLADRGGPIAKQLLNKFQFAVENMGLDLNAHVEWQGTGDALQHAQELDQFCIEVDQIINVHVASSDAPIHGTKFRGLAEASGLELNNDGKFYQHTNHNEPPGFVVIDMNNQPFTADSLRNSVLKGVTFQIEIPKVHNCEQAFNQMIILAQKMASSLNAQLVDDNQKPLGDLQIEKIRQQLRVIHATMVARGIMAGSPASMRLFN